jgi:hypothetical protein
VATDLLDVRIAEHWVATTRGCDRTLTWVKRGTWLWTRLRAALPEALSCVLMPDHVHLVLPPGGGERLRRVLLGFTVRFGVRFDLQPAEPANTVAIAGRMIRYGFFNAPRKGFVEDPWAWPWSTLRDLGGAVVEPWTPLERVADRLALPAATALRRLTTTADLEPPLPAACTIAAADVNATRQAVAAALRLADAAALSKRVPRRLAVQALYAIGAPNPSTLAVALGCSTRSIHRDRHPPEPGLPAVLRCLADPRLRTSPLHPPRAGRSWRHAAPG